MKSFAALVFLLTLSFQNNIFAQSDSAKTFTLRQYTITLGKEYYIYTLYDEVIFGKIIGSNSEEILANTEDGIISIKKDKIRSVTSDYPMAVEFSNEPTLSKYKTIWSFGGGLLFPSGGQHSFDASHNFQTAGDYKMGFTISANAVFPLSPYTAYKIEFDFSHIPNGENNSTGTHYHEYVSNSYQTGGSINEYSLRGGIGKGNFGSTGRTHFDIFLSLGFGLLFKEASSFYITVLPPYPSYDVIGKGSDSQLLISIGLSSSLKINLKNNFGIFIEPQAFIYAISNTPGQISLKTGVFF
ncbi:MAG: hypothetical protein PHN88_07110 [Ignavibacteria bacterium]|nr:hypothetical protein [Ignavibacteria bacterium]